MLAIGSTPQKACCCFSDMQHPACALTWKAVRFTLRLQEKKRSSREVRALAVASSYSMQGTINDSIERGVRFVSIFVAFCVLEFGFEGETSARKGKYDKHDKGNEGEDYCEKRLSIASLLLS